jgi:hypothetical protein
VKERKEKKIGQKNKKKNMKIRFTYISPHLSPPLSLLLDTINVDAKLTMRARWVIYIVPNASPFSFHALQFLSHPFLHLKPHSP